MNPQPAKVDTSAGVVSLAQLLQDRPTPKPCLIEPGLLPHQGILFVGGEPKVGQFFIAIDPGSFAPGGDAAYADRLETMLSALASEPGVRLPGVRRHDFKRNAEEQGVEVPQELIDKLEAFAAG